MPTAGYEPAMPASERREIHALEGPGIVIGHFSTT